MRHDLLLLLLLLSGRHVELANHTSGMRVCLSLHPCLLLLVQLLCLEGLHLLLLLLLLLHSSHLVCKGHCTLHAVVPHGCIGGSPHVPRHHPRHASSNTGCTTHAKLLLLLLR
jgi:hypothetical protein